MAGDSCARLEQVARRRTRRELEGPDPRDAELHWSSCECLNRSRRQPSGLREHLNQDSRRDHGVARKMSAKKPVLRRSRTTTTRTHTRDQIHDLLDESHRRLVREKVDRQLHARSIQCRPTRERPDDRISDSALTAHVLMQMAVILAFCRAVGWAARFVGQPQVVAEMIAGFLTALLVFGWLVPDVQLVFFPAESPHSLYGCRPIGLASRASRRWYLSVRPCPLLVVMIIATTLIAYPLLEWCIAESTPLVASHASTRHSPTHPRDHVK